MQFNLPRQRHNDNGPVSMIGKLFTSLFLSVFAVMGTGFLIFMIRSFLSQADKDWIMIPFMLIPVIFIMVGLGGIYGVWFGKKSKASKAAKAGKKMNERAVLILFGLVFFGAGSGFAYIMTIRPLMGIWAARSWVETPCKIVSAEVGVHDGDDGDTYSIDITYEYTFKEKKHRSDRYDFVGGSSSGYEGKNDVVNQYKKAKQPLCYVNPKQPNEAVLVRDLTIRNAIGLFPIPFVIIGAGIMIYGLRYQRKTGKAAWLPDNRDDTPDGQTVLTPTSTPLKKLLIVIAICLFWNGIISVFLYQVFEGFKHDRPEWFLTLFMIPFVAVGLALIGAVFYQLLAILNPRYRLTLQPERLHPGTSGMINWQAAGKAHRIRSLTVTLAGREEATYRVGTNTRTDKNTFFEMELIDTQDSYQIEGGSIGFVIPADTMHSFEADNNKIVWSMDIRGDIKFWPDVKQSYKIVITPKTVTL